MYEQMPEFIRTETLHPLTVHFPIALLLVATLFRLAHLFLRRKLQNRGAFLLPAYRLLLAIGVVSAWVAVFTGDLADGIVARVICDPTVLHSHELFAVFTSVIFSLALLIEIVILKFSHLTSGRLVSLLQIGVIFLVITGSATLAYTGHLGASLVYQQGAAVYQPDPECSEFTF